MNGVRHGSQPTPAGPLQRRDFALLAQLIESRSAFCQHPLLLAIASFKLIDAMGTIFQLGGVGRDLSFELGELGTQRVECLTLLLKLLGNRGCGYSLLREPPRRVLGFLWTSSICALNCSA